MTITISASWSFFLAVFLIMFGLTAFISVSQLYTTIMMLCALIAGVILLVSIVVNRK